MADTPAKPRRRWLRYSLRTLLVGITLVGVWFGYLADQAYKQRRAIEIVRKYGGEAQYAHELQRSTSAPAVPGWLRNVLGDDFFFRIDALAINSSYPSTDGVSASAITEEELLALTAVNPLIFRLIDIPVTDQFVNRLTNCTRLMQLDLHHVGLITDAGLASLHKLSQLQRLEIFGGDSSDEILAEITDRTMREIGQLRQLEDLWIANCKVTDVGLRELRDLKAVKSLSLANVDVNGDTLNALVDLPRLTHVLLAGVKLHEQGMESLGRMSQLKALTLNSAELSDAGVAHLGGLTNLQSLNLYDNPVTGRYLRQLTNLSSLQLGNTSTDDAVFDELVGFTKLYFLTLDNSSVRAETIDPQSPGLAKLELLDLSRTQITDAGLSRVVQLPALKGLALDGNSVTDELLIHLQRSPTLATVRLRSTAVTDAGITHLAAIQSLSSLDLRGTKVTLSGLEKLKATGLKELGLCDDQITREAAAEFEKASGIRVRVSRAEECKPK